MNHAVIFENDRPRGNHLLNGLWRRWMRRMMLPMMPYRKHLRQASDPLLSLVQTTNHSYVPPVCLTLLR